MPNAPFLPRITALGAGIGLVLLTAGCTPNLPAIDARLTPELEAADYPALVPLDQAAPPQTPPADSAQTLSDGLAARAAALRARADRLGQPVVDEAAKSRMDAGIRN